MKPFILIISILIIIGFIFWPKVNGQRLCYEIAKSKTDLYNSNILMNRWTQQKLCEVRMDNLVTLEMCVQESTAGGALSEYVNGVIPELIRLIRPYEKDVLVQKSEHNLDCQNFRWTLLP